jgi:hypothetical protein
MARSLALVTLSFLLLTLLAGCFPGGGSHSPTDPAGFFTGVWHGWIAPLSLILGIFDCDIRVYEAHNTGWWYDFGFYIAIIAGFGGIALTRRKKSGKGQ